MNLLQKTDYHLHSKEEQILRITEVSAGLKPGDKYKIPPWYTFPHITDPKSEEKNTNSPHTNKCTL